jgi:hypothetical protein
MRTWAEARVTTLSGLVLITLVLVATLAHIDRFHTASSDALILAGTWAFIATYIVLPPAFGWIIVRELRLPGGNPPRAARLSRWARATLAVQGSVLVAVGIALLVAPVMAAGL